MIDTGSRPRIVIFKLLGFFMDSSVFSMVENLLEPDMRDVLSYREKQSVSSIAEQLLLHEQSSEFRFLKDAIQKLLHISGHCL